MRISIIIIGKNSVKTLENCIESLRLSLVNSSFIREHEIIYIDSNSTDTSVQIAKKNDLEVIEIIDGYTTASLGRNLGKKYAKYENLVFIDSDMYLSIDWFNLSIEHYEKYGAIIGERYEKLYRDDKVIKEIPKFYDIKEIGIASNIGGFLMIKNELIKDINYTPIIKNEEEKDFYAKFYHKAKIYRVPVLAYIHNNYNLTSSRINDYLNPYTKNGYILSLINSIKKGYFRNYIKLQKKYLIAIVVSIIFYLSLVSVNIWGFGSLFLLLLNGKKQLKGSIMTTLFFPYKLIMSLFFLTKKIIAKYIYQNKEYELEIKL
ncbi:glycosyltransferase family 2 protein [Aliarcobacter cryaerophilus]|uniref:glycosyltransferase family 2 protein n=1 Tax=Aliarcobacter cryaerophilus TaxID=28198 RepID=UPI003DA5C7DF